MTISQENAGAANAERFVSPLPGYASAPTQSTHASPEPDSAKSSVALTFDGLTEPVYPPASWLAEPGLADHPLLRGLLMELPPKGAAPSPEWLNRWFEATRAILELIYVK